MKTTVNRLPKSQAEITIELEEKEVAKFRTAALAKIQKSVKIPGFRTGHAPEKMILEKYGEDMIRAEMIDIAVPKVVSEVVVAENFMPITRPDVRVESIEPVVFVATVTLFPEIELDEKYASVKIPEKKISVSKKEIETVIDSLLERNMERVPVDRASKKDDFVEVDFSGKTPDGVPLDGTDSKMHPVVLGSGQFIPGFEDQIIGLKKDEKKEFEITFPEKYGAKHLAGKPVIFSVTMRAVFEQKKPEITDEFAEKILDKKATVVEFHAEIEGMLREKAEEDERSRRENELLEEWTKLAKADLPEILTKEEVENMIRMMKMQILQSGLSWEKHLEHLKKTEEEFRESLKPDAGKRALQRLLIGKVLSESKIEVSEEEVHAALHHGHMPSDGHHHHHEQDSDEWRQAAHRARVEKLFDHFLGKGTISESVEK